MGWWLCFKKDDRICSAINWSKVASKFLQITNHQICAEVTGKRVDRGVELGLKIPLNFFYWDARIITWVKNSLEKLDNELHVSIKNMHVIHEIFKPSLCRYSTRSQMALDIPLPKTNTGKKSLSFLVPKIWSKIGPSIKNVRTSSSFMHPIKKNILLHLQS